MAKLFNNKKRILFLATVASTLQAFLIPIASGLREKGWQIDAGASNIHDIPELKNTFNQCYEISWSRNLFSLNNLKALMGLRKLIGQYTIIHVHTPIASFLIRLTCALFGFRGKLIYTAHGFHFHPEGNLFKNAIYLAAEKFAGFWTDYLIVINEEDYKAARKYKLVPSECLMRMNGIGIDTNFYTPSEVSESTASHLRNYFKIPAKAPIITMIAEFNNNKRHIDLIKAISTILKKREVYALFVGDGPLFFKTKQMVKMLDLSVFIRFLGHCNDNKYIRSLIKASTVIVLPSLREGLPHTTMEALSMETAVIGTNIRGNRELLSGGCGLLIPLMSPQNLANAILAIINDPKLAENIGRKGRKKMQGKYEINNIISQHNDLYKLLA